ncbi:MAG: hypothetical protein WC811_14535 [Hyphomicrobium sp.]|jgi:hypothetical protein
METINARSVSAKAVTENAKGDVSELHQTSEAQFATEDAATKTALAEQAERFRNAEARKALEEVRAQQEIAKNAPDVQQAEAMNKAAAAAINSEKALYEERRAKAEALKTAAESRSAELENQLQTAAQRANIIQARVEAIDECIKATDQKLANKVSEEMAVDNWGSLRKTTGEFYVDMATNPAVRYRFYRKECLPEQSTDLVSTNVPDQEAPSDHTALAPKGDCIKNYRSWQKRAKGWAAFATSDTECGWSLQGMHDANDARRNALASCGDENCRIYEEKSFH